MKLRVKVKRISEDVQLPRYAREGDAGFDLVAAEDTVIGPDSTIIIPTGLAFEIPPGYELQVRPRSGISARTSLLVMLGTVDSSYRGEVGVIVRNTSSYADSKNRLLFTVDGEYEYRKEDIELGTYLIRKGDRIAQGVIAPVETAHFEEVDELSESQRGTGGFGSTGVKS